MKEKSAFQTAGASWMVGRFTVMEAETFNSGQRERGGGAASQIPQTRANSKVQGVLYTEGDVMPSAVIISS